RAGVLCAACAQDYRASKNVCVECKNVSLETRLSIGLGCAMMLVIVAAVAWILRRHVPQLSPRSECLLQLIIAQLAALLQLTQLWTVLGALTPAVDPAANVADAANVTEDDNSQRTACDISEHIMPLKTDVRFTICPSLESTLSQWTAWDDELSSDSRYHLLVTDVQLFGRMQEHSGRHQHSITLSSSLDPDQNQVVHVELHLLSHIEVVELLCRVYREMRSTRIELESLRRDFMDLRNRFGMSMENLATWREELAPLLGQAPWSSDWMFSASCKAELPPSLTTDGAEGALEIAVIGRLIGHSERPPASFDAVKAQPEMRYRKAHQNGGSDGLSLEEVAPARLYGLSHFNSILYWSIETVAYPGDPLLGYLEALQFTSSEVQNFLALQCFYDGATVRSMFAIATPLVPLLLLIACGCVEVFSRGLGIRVGLKMLTVLFIGGASGSAQLLGCQRTDGAGTALKEFAFRPLFPHERCEEAIWVDRVGWATAICYGFFIPCFLGFLFAKQNVVMRKVKTVVMQTAGNEAKVTVRLQGPKSEESEKDALAQHLKAAAAAYVAVHVKGRATVELQKDAT
ncbi:unnamed protein product, partial [Cladocopium goreaui]